MEKNRRTIQIQIYRKGSDKTFAHLFREKNILRASILDMHADLEEIASYNNAPGRPLKIHFLMIHEEFLR